MTQGKVILVGAGPGDPGLITVRGAEALRRSEVVLYDRLVNPALLEYAPEGALRIFTGKRPGSQDWPQPAINALMILHARAGRTVVRLKGGDPFVFGRGREEVRALEDAGVGVEVVCGVTAAVAVPACAGIPLTERHVSSSFAVVTGHEAPGKIGSSVRWDKLATAVDTIVVLMGVGALPEIAARLMAHGRPPETPVAVISRGGSEAQQVIVGDLANIAARAAGAEAPATVVIGEVVHCGDALPNAERLPSELESADERALPLSS